jgi:membrane glycosyltransferase
LPQLPDGSSVLSHDQIEAVLMRRAGFAVRVLPEENLGWEQNPPTLVEFMRRDLRWCQGNMQYWTFLRMPGLLPVSRFQLAFAIIMFIGSPGWIGLMVLTTLMLAAAPSAADVIDPMPALAVFWLVLMMWYAPKIATVVDVLLRPDARAVFGGGARFLAGVVAETVFFQMLSHIMWFGHTLHLAGRPFGRTRGWAGQRRDDHRVGVAVAARAFWRETVFGLAILAVLAATHPGAVPFALVFCGGLAAAIPFAVITSSPDLGKFLVRIGLGRLPEETVPPPVLRAIAVPAIEVASPPVRTCAV